MKEYNVKLPVLIEVSVTIEAENESAAISKAIEGFDAVLKSDSGQYESINIEVFDKLSSGNTFYGSIGKAEVEENKF